MRTSSCSSLNSAVSLSTSSLAASTWERKRACATSIAAGDSDAGDGKSALSCSDSEVPVLDEKTSVEVEVEVEGSPGGAPRQRWMSRARSDGRAAGSVADRDPFIVVLAVLMVSFHGMENRMRKWASSLGSFSSSSSSSNIDAGGSVHFLAELMIGAFLFLAFPFFSLFPLFFLFFLSSFLPSSHSGKITQQKFTLWSREAASSASKHAAAQVLHIGRRHITRSSATNASISSSRARIGGRRIALDVRACANDEKDILHRKSIYIGQHAQ